MNFNEEKLKSILEDVCKVDYVYSYLPIIIKYSYPDFLSFEKELLSKGYRINTFFNYRQIFLDKCNCDKKDYIIYFQSESFNKWEYEKDLAFTKNYICRDHLGQPDSIFLCKVFIGNIRVFDIITGNEVKEN